MAMRSDLNLEIGERVKEKRKELKYTREALAEILDISPQFLAQIECGKRGMSFSTLRRLCRVLGVSCDYLIMGRGEDGDNPYPRLVYNILQGLSADCGKAVFDIASLVAGTVGEKR